MENNAQHKDLVVCPALETTSNLCPLVADLCMCRKHDGILLNAGRVRSVQIRLDLREHGVAGDGILLHSAGAGTPLRTAPRLPPLSSRTRRPRLMRRRTRSRVMRRPCLMRDPNA